MYTSEISVRADGTGGRRTRNDPLLIRINL